MFQITIIQMKQEFLVLAFYSLSLFSGRWSLISNFNNQTKMTSLQTEGNSPSLLKMAFHPAVAM